jgi:hypothetical protein
VKDETEKHEFKKEKTNLNESSKPELIFQISNM